MQAALRRQRQPQKDPFRPMYLDLDHLLAKGEKYLVDGGPHRADIIAELAVAVSAQQDPYELCMGNPMCYNWREAPGSSVERMLAQL